MAVAFCPLVLSKKQCSGERDPGPQSQASQSMWLSSQIPTQLHLAGEARYLPVPQQDVDTAMPCQVACHAGHTLPVSRTVPALF